MTPVDEALLGPAAYVDADAMAARMRAVLPAGWFSERGGDASSPTPVLDSVLSGTGVAWAMAFQQLQAIFTQTRLGTATAGGLDMIAYDFFGPALQRAQGEGDDPYRSRIRAALLPHRATRDALKSILAALAPIEWRITEPNRISDTGVVSDRSGLYAAGGYDLGPLRYGSRSFAFGLLIEGISDAPSGIRTDRSTPATLVNAAGQMEITPPFAVRYLSGQAVGEPAGWNMICDSLGWTGFDLDGTASSLGSRAICKLERSNDALFKDAFLLSCTLADGRQTGPAISVAVGSRAAVASCWVMVPSDPKCTAVRLICEDSGSSSFIDANMSIRGVWQRLIVEFGPQANVRDVTLALQFEATGSICVLTQCWQVEPGNEATSFIPSQGSAGYRAADHFKNVAQPVSAALTVSAIASTVASALPTAIRCGVRLLSS